MATFVKNNGGYIEPEYYTEPCMSCYASVTYNKNEAMVDEERTAGHYIICPSCGKKMKITFCNICLC